MSQALLMALGMALGASVLTLASPLAHADPISKHPRAVELEDRIAKDASAYLRGRFPDRPFIVTVSIDPLRRREAVTGAQGASVGREHLPYLELQNEEIQDEWDDPQISLTELMGRIRKIQVSVTLPDTVLDPEIVEIRTSMYASLHLLAARDEIVIERHAWKESTTPMTPWALVAAVALVMLLLGAYTISRSAMRTLTTALSQSRGSANVHVNAVSGGDSGSASSAGERSSERGLPQDVQLSDPTKIRELAAELVETLTAKAEFPNHLDMFELDRVGQANPSALGAVLGLFPQTTQKKLFSLSFHSFWLEALRAPGSPTFESLEVLHRMVAHPREPESADWERLIILIWRLDEQRAEFMRQLKREEALGMLAALPKTFSVATARKAFPGAWGEVLDPSHEHKPISKQRIAEFQAKALSICPLNDDSIIARYKNEHDLLIYLRGVDVEEEREIYLVSPAESMIHKLRPPFFKIFEASEDVLKAFVPRFNPQEWAVALFNINRTDVRKIDKFFTDKQRYLFIENLKRLDTAAPDRGRLGETRERLAREFSKLTAKAQAPEIQTQGTSNEEAADDQAA